MECRSPSPSNPTHPFERNTWRSKRWVGLEGGRQAALHLDIPTSIYLDYTYRKMFLWRIGPVGHRTMKFLRMRVRIPEEVLMISFSDWFLHQYFICADTYTHSLKQTDRETDRQNWVNGVAKTSLSKGFASRQ